jgi:hypothetical protein
MGLPTPYASFPPRSIYVILSPHSLQYARYGLQSLLLNSLDTLDITLVTDTQQDRETLLQAADQWHNPCQHRIRVLIEEDLADAEATVFSQHPNLRHFRHGHPCWRKITDPLLVTDPAQEIIILDPDLYFPNRFRFEPTPSQGLLLMWQKPNCLLPPEVVRQAMNHGIPLARHVDIGVAHWRFPADLDWLDWLLGKLGGPALPRAMHVEAIVWAAIAMRFGGGHLDAHYWRCWQRTAGKRVMRKLKFSGRSILQLEPWSQIKCFHAGGEAKWWLSEMHDLNNQNAVIEHTEPGIVRPFVELTPKQYEREESQKRLLHKLDYFHVFR